MGEVRFQIGVPRVGSAARLAEGAEPTAHMPLPRAGSAARDAELRKKLEEDEARRSLPVMGLRGTGGRVVSMEEMIAASRPAGSTGMPAGAAALGTAVQNASTAPTPNRATSPVSSAVPARAGKVDLPHKMHAAGQPSGGTHSSVMGAEYRQDAQDGMVEVPAMPATRSTFRPAQRQSSVLPGLPEGAANRIKALVHSLFFRER